MSRASSNMRRGLRVTGKILKTMAAGLILGVVVLLAWRLLSAGTPRELKPLTANDKLCAAYEKYGDDLYMFKQGHKSLTTAERNRGYFGFTEYVIIPEANQIQMVFRYNNSTIRKVSEELKLDPVPSVDDYLFDVSLYIQTDLTPENKEDNGGNIEGAVEYTRLLPSEEPLHGQKNLYNYYRYVFDFSDQGLDLSELLDSGRLLAVYADIYYVGNINYEETPYGTLFLYDYKSDRTTVRLSGKDEKAIVAYREK